MKKKELTDVDIKKIQEELDYRIKELQPQLLEDVKTTRAFGDLSENFEYKEAKRQWRKNCSRINYLNKLLETALVVDINDDSSIVGLFSKVKVKMLDSGKEENFQIVTPLRINMLEHLISRESPIGKALWGHKEGDIVEVFIADRMSYKMQILKIEQGEDREDLDILTY